MALASTHDQKVKIIDDIFNKMSQDEKKIILRKLIKFDMKLFFDTIQDEMKFLEEESGIDGAYLEEATGCTNTSAKIYPETEEKDIEDVRPENIGTVSKEAQNAWLDEKRKEKMSDDKYDGFLGYVNSKENKDV